MRARALIGVCLVVCVQVGCLSAAERKDDYVVVSLVPKGDAYYAAVEELARLRGGRIIAATYDDMDKLLDELRRARPKYAAVVVRPETVDENFARKFLVLATKLDDDPFVDVAYGFITGDAARTAVALAGAGVRAEQQRRRPNVAMVGVASAEQNKSTSSSQPLPLREGSLPYTGHVLAGGDSASGNAGDDLNAGRDERFIRGVMPKLADHSILLFAGHGYPRQICGGPTYQHLTGQRYDGAIAMNIACFTGVTSRWYDSDWQAMKTSRREVPSDESFCLNMLKTGVAGYVAYVSARPAGPAMLGDAITIATAGESVGEMVRDNANSVVLAHLQQGYDGLHVVEAADGAPIDPQRKVRDVLLEMSTGGVLFGDPAHVPFENQPGKHPIQVDIELKADSLTAKFEAAGLLFHLFCSDQVTMWAEGKPSWRLEANVPLGDRYAKDVRLTDSSLGDTPHRLVAAVEEHGGKRYLRVKSSFEQPKMAQMMLIANVGVRGTFEIETSSEPQEVGVIRHAIDK